MVEKSLILSLDKRDFELQFIKGSGKGGQKKNKTSNACRIIHKDSGAVGFAQDTRSQSQNKKLAFQRLIESKKFKMWHKKKIAEILIDQEHVEKRVEELMAPQNIKVEGVNPNTGNWEEID